MLCFWGLLKIMKIIFFSTLQLTIVTIEGFGTLGHVCLAQSATHPILPCSVRSPSLLRIAVSILRVELPDLLWLFFTPSSHLTISFRPWIWNTQRQRNIELLLYSLASSPVAASSGVIYLQREKKKLTEKKNLSSHIGWESMQYRLRCESLWYFLQ